MQIFLIKNPIIISDSDQLRQVATYRKKRCLNHRHDFNSLTKGAAIKIIIIKAIGNLVSYNYILPRNILHICCDEILRNCCFC